MTDDKDFILIGMDDFINKRFDVDSKCFRDLVFRHGFVADNNAPNEKWKSQSVSHQWQYIQFADVIVGDYFSFID